jgi:hypothetical protein
VWGRIDIAPPFLNQTLDGSHWSSSCPGRFTPNEIRPPVRPGYEVGSVPEPVWTLLGVEPGFLGCHPADQVLYDAISIFAVRSGQREILVSSWVNFVQRGR